MQMRRVPAGGRTFETAALVQQICASAEVHLALLGDSRQHTPSDQSDMVMRQPLVLQQTQLCPGQLGPLGRERLPQASQQCIDPRSGYGLVGHGNRWGHKAQG